MDEDSVEPTATRTRHTRDPGNAAFVLDDGRHPSNCKLDGEKRQSPAGDRPLIYCPDGSSGSTIAGWLADCGWREQSPARAASKLTLSIAAIG
jgi:hypothetical protein